MSDDLRYNAAYVRRHYKAFTIRLKYSTERDLIDYIESFGSSPQNAIKSMIQSSYRRHRNETLRNTEHVKAPDQ